MTDVEGEMGDPALSNGRKSINNSVTRAVPNLGACRVIGRSREMPIKGAVHGIYHFFVLDCPFGAELCPRTYADAISQARNLNASPPSTAPAQALWTVTR